MESYIYNIYIGASFPTDPSNKKQFLRQWQFWLYFPQKLFYLQWFSVAGLWPLKKEIALPGTLTGLSNATNGNINKFGDDVITWAQDLQVIFVYTWTGSVQVEHACIIIHLINWWPGL